MALNFLGHEAVRRMVNSMAGYKPNGEPTWLLRTVRTICVQFMRALGVAYPGMPAAEKMNLCRLMVFEGMQRSLRARNGEEAMHLFFCVFFALKILKKEVVDIDTLISDPPAQYGKFIQLAVKYLIKEVSSMYLSCILIWFY